MPPPACQPPACRGDRFLLPFGDRFLLPISKRFMNDFIPIPKVKSENMEKYNSKNNPLRFLDPLSIYIYI